MFDPWVGKILWRKEILLTPIFWPGEFHGRYSPWGRKESDTTKQLSLHCNSLLGRIAMSNLDSVLKCRDITLPTRVHIVKATFFPVVMCGCENWTIKNAEH